MQSVGIVFKQDELVIAALREGARDLLLDEYRVVPLQDFDAEQRQGAIVHNLEQVFRSHRSARDNVFIVLPRDVALVKFIQLPLAVEADLQETLSYEIERFTPFTSDNVYFDYQVVRRHPDSDKIDVLLVTLQRKAMDSYLELFSQLKVRLRGVEITTTALCSAAAAALLPAASRTAWQRLVGAQPDSAPPDGAGGYLLLERLAAGRWENVVLDRAGAPVHAGVVRTREPVDFSALRHQAEQTLINLPSGGDGPDEVTLLLSGLPRDDAGDGAGLQWIERLPVCTDRCRQTLAAADVPRLTVAVGAARKGLTRSSLDINLLPASQRPRKKLSLRKIVPWVAVVAIVFVGAGLAGRGMLSLQQRYAELNQRLDELRLEVRSVEQIQLEAEETDRFALAIEDIREGGVSRLQLLSELTNLIPEDSWLTELNFDADSRQVRLSGYSDSASQLIPLLEESRLFESVRFTSPITTDRRSGKEKFRIEMRYSPGAGQEAQP